MILGLLAFIAPLLFPFADLSLAGQMALGIFLFAAVFWVLEPIPIYATSLLVILLQVLLLSSQGPFAAYTQPDRIQPSRLEESIWQIPAESVTNENQIFLAKAGRFQPLNVEVLNEDPDWITIQSDQISPESLIAADARHWQVEFAPPAYTLYLNTMASPIIILFLGGFIMAAGAAKYGVDRNVMRIILKPFGTKPAFIMLGLMTVTALLSAFMSNTATTAMMMAAVIPVLMSAPEGDRFRVGVALSIPFAANIGGIATPIGTPPNAIALGALAEQGIILPFTSWMALTTPLVIVMLLLTWALLLRLYPSSLKQLTLSLSGSFDHSFKAWVLYIILGLTVLLWVTEALHGLSSSLVALIPIALLTAFQVVDKKEIRNLPWEVLWLMAGGLALGVAMRETGLAEWMIGSVPWGLFGALGALAIFGLASILLANFIAHTVAATLLMPLVMSLVSSGVADGFALQTAALTVAIGASLGMSLPISTPPNAIAMSTGFVRTIDMARAGVIVGIVGYVIMMAMALLIWNHLF